MQLFALIFRKEFVFLNAERALLVQALGWMHAGARPAFPQRSDGGAARGAHAARGRRGRRDLRALDRSGLPKERIENMN